MTKRFGFTLAEVLITLGIIGVVAAMTIPTLISNTNGAQFKTAYKKALSTLNQAILMNIAMDDEDFSTIGDDKETQANTGTRLSEIFAARLSGASSTDNEITRYFAANTNGFKVGEGADAKTPVLTYQMACEGSNAPTVEGGTATACSNGTSTVTINMTAPTESNARVFNMADGTSFIYLNDAYDCTKEDAVAHKCYGFIDVNGDANPNRVIDCDEGTGTEDVPCTVSSTGVTDIYPVVFYGQTVEPASDAARAVLFGK